MNKPKALYYANAMPHLRASNDDDASAPQPAAVVVALRPAPPRSAEDALLICEQADQIVQLEQVIAEQAVELYRLRRQMEAPATAPLAAPPARRAGRIVAAARGILAASIVPVALVSTLAAMD